MTKKQSTTTKQPVASAKAVKTSKKPVTKKSTTAKVVKKVPEKQAKTAAVAKTEVIKKPKKAPKVITMSSLHTWNKWLALLHFSQGVLIVILSTSTLFPVVTNFLAIDPLATGQTGGMPTLVPATEQIGTINLAYLVAAFFFMSAAAHAFIATVYRKRYEAGLSAGINKVRWYEYSLSASTMMVGIGALVGVTSLSAFIMMFALTAVMNLLGLVMEVTNQGKSKVSWLSFNIGCIAGIAPWIVISEYLISGAMYGSKAPTFVYWIFVSMFLFFTSFAVNMYLQYKGIGKWKNYLYGERAYMILSLVAKTALAWQVFAGSLRP